MPKKKSEKKKKPKNRRDTIILGVSVFFVVVTSTLLLLPSAAKVELHNKTLFRTRFTSSQVPVLYKVDTFPLLSAQAAVAIDLDSAVVLYEKNADGRMLPASTTKILTALVALEEYKPDEVVTVGKIKVIGQKMKLVTGEKIKVIDLIKALLIFSANDAAEALAEHYPGGRESFIKRMNDKASELSLDNSNFANPSGLDDVNHYTSARDMVRLSQVAMQNSIFAEIVSTKETTVSSVDGKILHRLRNINALSGSVEGVKGVKTGWTEAARENLVSFVERDNRKIMIAILGSQDRFGESRELIDWLFDNVHWEDLSYFP